MCKEPATADDVRASGLAGLAGRHGTRSLPMVVHPLV